MDIKRFSEIGLQMFLCPDFEMALEALSSSKRVLLCCSFGAQDWCDFAALSDIANLTQLGPHLFDYALRWMGKGGKEKVQQAK